MQFEGINLDKFRQSKLFLDIFSYIQNANIFLGIFRRDKFRQIQIYLVIFRCNLRVLIQTNLDKANNFQVYLVKFRKQIYFLGIFRRDKFR